MPGIANNWPPWRTIVIFSWTAFEETDWRRVLGLSSLEIGWDILMDFLRFRVVLSRLFWIWRTRGSKNQNLEGTESKFRNLLCILHKPPPRPSFTNKIKLLMKGKAASAADGTWLLTLITPCSFGVWSIESRSMHFRFCLLSFGLVNLTVFVHLFVQAASVF